MHASALPAVLPVVLIGFLSLLTPKVTPKTVQFGVRVPAERAGDPAVASAGRIFRTGIVAVTVVAVLVGTFVETTRAAVLAALPVETVGSAAVYLMARSHIAAAKRDGRWFEGRTQVTVADTTLRTRPEPFPWLWTLPAVAVTAGTAIVGVIRYPHLPDRLVSHFDAGGHPTSYTGKSIGSAFALVLVQAGITALIVGLSVATARGKAHLDAHDPHAAERHRRFVAAMARCLLVLAAAADLSMFFAALALWKLAGSTGFFPVLVVAPIVLATAWLIVVTVRVGQGGSRLRFGTTPTEGDEASADGGAATVVGGAATVAGGAGARGPGIVNRDDDRFWKLGLIYVNREDPAVFVPKRFGVGWTVNFARPTAVGLLVGILAIAMLVPILAGSR
jgi:uncharacterized membrane protein